VTYGRYGYEVHTRPRREDWCGRGGVDGLARLCLWNGVVCSRFRMLNILGSEMWCTCTEA
jgi:hypothetical protein